MSNVKHIVVHCSATPPDMDIGRAQIDTWHKQKGWSGIGYHYVIRRNGNVEIGRPLDEDSILEPNEVGAHVQGFNSRTVGICMVGGVRRGEGGKLFTQNNFTPEQFATLVRLLKKMRVQFPQATIVGHRDLNPGKDCPSFSVKDLLLAKGFSREWL